MRQVGCHFDSNNTYHQSWLDSGLIPLADADIIYTVKIKIKSLNLFFELQYAAYSPEDALLRAPYLALKPDSFYRFEDLEINIISSHKRDTTSSLNPAEMHRRQFLYHLAAASTFIAASSSMLRLANAGTTIVTLSGTSVNFCSSIGSNGQSYCGGTVINNGKGVSFTSTSVNAASVNSFIVPCGVNSVVVTVIGAGGGGGDNNTGPNGDSKWGGGGGGGTNATLTVSPLSTISVTVAGPSSQMTNGGSSSFGSLLSATGGLCGSSDNSLRGVPGNYSGGTGSAGGQGGNGSTSPTSGYTGGGGGGNGWYSGVIGTTGASASGLYGGGGGGAADQGWMGGSTGGKSGGSGGPSGYGGGSGLSGAAARGTPGLGPVGGAEGNAACDSRGCGMHLTFQGGGGGGSYGGGGGCGGGWGSGGGGGAGGLIMVTWV